MIRGGRRWAVLASAAVVLLSAHSAWAQRQDNMTTDPPATAFLRDAGPHSRPVDLSVLVGTPGALLVGVGGGVRIAIPLVHDGFIGSANNAIKLETGAEFYRWSFAGFEYSTIAVPVLLRWDFFLTPQWTVFGAMGVAVNVFYFGGGGGFFEAPNDTAFWGFGSGALITTALGAGALLNISDAVSLRLDASLNLLAIGLTFRL